MLVHGASKTTSQSLQRCPLLRHTTEDLSAQAPLALHQSRTVGREAAAGMRPAGASAGRHIGKNESSVFPLALNPMVPCPRPLLRPAPGRLRLEPGPSTHRPAAERSAASGHPSGSGDRQESQTARGSLARLAGAPSSGDDLREGSKPAAWEPTRLVFVSCVSGMTHLQNYSAGLASSQKPQGAAAPGSDHLLTHLWDAQRSLQPEPQRHRIRAKNPTRCSQQAL